MSRIQLRPALRAYAHAPAAAPVAAELVNGYSASFDGSDDFFGSAANGGIPGGSYSYSFWFNGANLQTAKVFMSSFDHASLGIRADLTVAGNKIYIWDGAADDGHSYDQDLAYTGIAADTWYHVAVTSEGDGSTNSVQFYLDGSPTYEFDGSNSTAGSLTQYLAIGAGQYASLATQLPFDGLIDEVGVWRGTVLTPTEVGLIYNGGGTGLPGDLMDTTGLTAPDSYYRMGDLDDTDGAAGVIEDQAGSYDLTAGDTNGGGAPAASTTVKT